MCKNCDWYFSENVALKSEIAFLKTQLEKAKWRVDENE